MDATLKRIVLLITDSLDAGGAERQLLLLAQNLPEQWKSIVLTLCTGPLLEKVKKLDIETYIAKRRFRFDILIPFLEIERLIKSIQPDVVHSWGWMSTMASALILRRMDIPHVSGVIRLGGVPNRKRYRIKYAARLGNITIANSYAGLQAWGVPEYRGKVIHNGFDWGRIPKSDEYEHKINGSYNVTMIASMADRKDWNAFLDVAELSNIQYRDRKILFTGYGTGPQREKLLKRSEKLRSTGTLQLPGKTENPIESCLRTNIGILLSTFGEGISNSIMEFMACRRPVICSRSGGNPELVVDGVTGFMVEPDNPPEQILEKVIWLQDHPEKSIEMGNAGREKLRNEFSIDKMVQNTVDIYTQFL